MAITNNGTSSFVGSCVSILVLQVYQKTHPPSCNRGYLTGSLLQNFKNKKNKTKEAKTEVNIIRNASQVHFQLLFQTPKYGEERGIFSQNNQWENGKNFGVEDLDIFIYLQIHIFYI